MIPLVLSLLFAPDLAALSSDDWRTREAASKRLAGTTRGAILAVVCPNHADPEVRFRLQLGRHDYRLTVAAAFAVCRPEPCPFREAHWWADRPDRLAALERVATRLGLHDPDCENPAWHRWSGEDQFLAAAFPFAASVGGWLNVTRGRATAWAWGEHLAAAAALAPVAAWGRRFRPPTPP